jgi:hypothetical protein
MIFEPVGIEPVKETCVDVAVKAAKGAYLETIPSPQYTNLTR